MTVIDVTERPVFKLGPDYARTAYPNGVASGEVFGTTKANAVVVATGVASTITVGTASTVASTAVSGISGASALGTPTVVYLLAPTGIAGASALGTGKTVATAQPTEGLPSSAALGTTTAFTSMNPSGFSSVGDLGSPSLNLVMSPDGIAGTEAFGDADTLATVFIIPGPVDPSNDFGNPVATKYGWIFRTPRNTYQWRVPPYKEYEGISLLKESGAWVEVAHPDLERTLTATKYLAGGRDHVVSDTLKADLVAAGYSVTTEIVTTEDYKS